MDKNKKMKLKDVKRICPICSNKHGERLHKQEFQLYGRHCLPDVYEVIACDKCGFVYNDMQASQKDYNDFYSRFSKYESSISPGGRINQGDRDKYERMAKDLIALGLDKQASILDIGCAKGGLLATLKNHGFNNLTGLDPSPNCVEQVKAQGLKAIQGGLFAENFPEKTLTQEFDCVIVSHVIEHVYDIATAIQNAFAFVKPGGMLYLEVPDATRYTQYYVTPFHYFDFEHINHFDEQSLNNLMSRYNCAQIASGKKDLQHSNIVYYPAVYSVYQKNEKHEKRRGIVPDYGVRENVIRYIEMSRQADDWPDLEKLVETQEEIVVWGAAAYASRLYKTTPLSKCNILSFIDNDLKKQGTEFDKNLKIDLPKNVLPKFKGPIVVCSAVYNNEIVKEIAQHRYNNRVVVLR